MAAVRQAFRFTEISRFNLKFPPKPGSGDKHLHPIAGMPVFFAQCRERQRLRTFSSLMEWY
jgi:hypothetical protein